MHLPRHTQYSLLRHRTPSLVGTGAPRTSTLKHVQLDRVLLEVERSVPATRGRRRFESLRRSLLGAAASRPLMSGERPLGSTRLSLLRAALGGLDLRPLVIVEKVRGLAPRIIHRYLVDLQARGTEP